jgi:hypothetical protein
MSHRRSTRTKVPAITAATLALGMPAMKLVPVAAAPAASVLGELFGVYYRRSYGLTVQAVGRPPD